MKTIVVDLGCMDWGNGTDSISALVEEYQPDHIYGFDPSSSLVEGETEVAGVPVTIQRKAAWTHDGTVLFHEDGWGSRIGAYGGEAECFDFSAWLRTIKKRGTQVIVKMDIEGAEFELLPRLIEDGTDKLIKELLVEWHGEGDEIEGRLSCPVRHWWM